jgi:hypothetical protein
LTLTAATTSGQSISDAAPAANWTQLNPVSAPVGGRAKYSLVSLPNNRAIAICGTFFSQDDDLGTSTTALFQLGPNTWSPGPSLPSYAAPRVWCSAVWLPTIQKVLIFGGLSSSISFHATAFPKPSDYVYDCYLYDPSTNGITRTGDLPAGHGSLSVSVGACLLRDGRLLRAGGMVLPNASAKSAIYDPSTGVWTATPDMNVPRGEYGDPIPLANGKVLVAGGTNPPPGAKTWVIIEYHLSSAEIYDPVANTWALTDPMIVPAAQAGRDPTAYPETAFGWPAFAPSGGPPDWLARRWQASSVPLDDGRALIIGGGGSFMPPTPTGDVFGNTTYYERSRPSCLIYDDSQPSGKKWRQTGNLNTPSGGGFAKLRAETGQVIKVAGYEIPGTEGAGNSSAACEVFDGQNWTPTASLPLQPGSPPFPIFNGLEVSQYGVLFPNGGPLLFAFGLPDLNISVFSGYPKGLPANPISALLNFA